MDAEVKMVRVVEQVGVGVQEADDKEAVVFCGRPETVKDTACAVPETRLAVIVLKAEAPWVTVLSPSFLREKLKLLVALCARTGIRTKPKARSNRSLSSLLFMFITIPPMRAKWASALAAREQRALLTQQA